MLGQDYPVALQSVRDINQLDLGTADRILQYYSEDMKLSEVWNLYRIQKNLVLESMFENLHIAHFF